ncbi:MAG: MATE family efflux transporter [Butyrivibrio sp.]|uniref:MATE family efflux transporter n=1 Tax=Butyrivibrio sp. TaxID=28121 RepID=UPI0025E90166|nr:MATE family efflux transporter [Butyrivibrio sp.]MCR5771975.1 MATE family efflux transporter [Butyrivibrio sp.]
MDNKTQNPLGSKKISTLLKEFAIPSIIAMLVSSLYNVVDQLFIGQKIGELGNAATNVVYPLVPACIATALLFGIGGASNFNLSMGRGQKDGAKYFIGNAAFMAFFIGSIIAIFSEITCSNLLVFFGASIKVYPLAESYLRVTAIGFPFLIFSSCATHLIRADGSPKYSMKMNLAGAITNIILDYVFIFIFGWGMFGVGFATIIGQILSAVMGAAYLRKYKTVKLDISSFIPKGEVVFRIASLGAANCFNQLAMMILAIVLNKSLNYYGGLSQYGTDIPLAVSGVSLKCMQIMMAFVIGLSQGLQPIASFNYGAQKYARVKEALFGALKAGAVISIIGFLIFQIFPYQVIEMFGKGSKEYFEFGVKYIRIYYLFLFTYFIQPIVSNFFSAIGKPVMGIFLSLTRQVIFFLPLLLILPLFFGINGILYAGAVTDFIASTVCTIIGLKEITKPKYSSK